MVIKAGTLDRSVALQTYTETRSATGATTRIPATSCTVRAALMTLRVADLKRGEALSSVAEIKFMIRWRVDVSITTLLTYHCVQYQIISIDEVGKREGLILLVKAAAQ
jgi:head-tail adaptor